jgi:hypothetical protein
MTFSQKFSPYRAAVHAVVIPGASPLVNELGPFHGLQVDLSQIKLKGVIILNHHKFIDFNKML